MFTYLWNRWYMVLFVCKLSFFPRGLSRQLPFLQIRGRHTSPPQIRWALLLPIILHNTWILQTRYKLVYISNTRTSCKLSLPPSTIKEVDREGNMSGWTAKNRKSPVIILTPSHLIAMELWSLKGHAICPVTALCGCCWCYKCAPRHSSPAPLILVFDERQKPEKETQTKHLLYPHVPNSIHMWLLFKPRRKLIFMSCHHTVFKLIMAAYMFEHYGTY